MSLSSTTRTWPERWVRDRGPFRRSRLARGARSSSARLNLPVNQGALVQQVTPGSPAAKAGIRGGDVPAQLNGSSIQLGGDIIVAVNGKPIASSDALASTIGSMKPGSTAKLTILRGGKRKQVEVKLGNRPQQAPQGSQQSSP